MDSLNEILENIVHFQNTKGYTDEQMADKIGCSRPLYQRTRTNKVPVGGTFLRGAMKLLASETDTKRLAVVNRETSETSIALELNIDGTGKYEISTGINMLDHLMSQLAKHGMFDITLKASGDDPHHTVEDVAICLGKAFAEALAEKRGIMRMADVTVPMDETLAAVALDISGRGYAVLDLSFFFQDQKSRDQKVKIIPIITALDEKNQPVFESEKIVSTDSIVLNESPLLILPCIDEKLHP